MQEYNDVLASNTVQEMRTMVNNNLNTLRSTHAGEAFPTENLVLGMKCFRTDEKKTYTLVSIDPVEWKVEARGMGEQERAEIVSQLEFLASITVDALGRCTDWSGLFHRAVSLELVDFSKLGTGKKVTNMSKLFHKCVSLYAVLHFKIVRESSVRDVHGMFSECNKLSVLDAAGFAAENVAIFTDMFSGCHELKALDVSAWQTGLATDMSGMFRNCWKLESLDVSKWNVGKCTNLAEMFMGCRRLRGLDFTSWDTSKATAMGGMFKGMGGELSKPPICKLDLTALDLSNVEVTSNMFAFTHAELIIGEKMRRTGKCRNMRGMFSHFMNLSDVVVAGETYTPPVIQTDYPHDEFTIKPSIFTAFDLSAAVDMSDMFAHTYNVNCKIQKCLDAGRYEIIPGLIFHVSTPNVINISNMFEGATGAEFIDFSMDTGRVTNMMNLFDAVTAESIRLRNFDTRHIEMCRTWDRNKAMWVTEHSYADSMFRNCRRLRYLIIDGTEFRFKLLTDILADLPAACRFIVPRAMIATYKAQDFWKNYPDRFLAMEDCQLYGAYVKSAPA